MASATQKLATTALRVEGKAELIAGQDRWSEEGRSRLAEFIAVIGGREDRPLESIPRWASPDTTLRQIALEIAVSR